MSTYTHHMGRIMLFYFRIFFLRRLRRHLVSFILETSLSDRTDDSDAFIIYFCLRLDEVNIYSKNNTVAQCRLSTLNILENQSRQLAVK